MCESKGVREESGKWEAGTGHLKDVGGGEHRHFPGQMLPDFGLNVKVKSVSLEE